MPVKYTRERLAEAAATCSTYSEVIRTLGGLPTRGSRRYVRDLMRAHGIDTSHFQREGVRHTDHRIREAVSKSRSTGEVVRRLGLDPVGGNHAHIGRRIASLGIDTSHFGQLNGSEAEKNSPRPTLSLSVRERGRVRPERLRSALRAHGRDETCAECGVGAEWQGMPLRLEVDHINGSWWDNRVENLRFLCPNCHSVTDTHRGRKPRRR